MKIIKRYLYREYLINLVYCLSAFCMIFIMYDLFDNMGRLLEAGASWLTMTRYYLGILSMSVEFLAPASLLLATLYTLWRLTRHNEITAMRASGISLYSVITPFLGVGLAFTLISGGIKEFVAPHAAFWSTTFAKNKFTEADYLHHPYFAYFNSKARRQWNVNIFDLKQPGLLRGVKVTQERSDGTRVSELSAITAQYLDGQWWFTGVQTLDYDAGGNPVGQPTPATPDPHSFEEMPQFDETPSDLALEVKPWEYLSVREMLRYLNNRSNISERAHAQRWFDIHNRLAAPWACLVVTIFGIPAGVRGGRQNALAGVLLAIALFFAFYALSQVGVFLGKREVVPPWVGAWLSNLIFFAAGLGMSRRLP